MSTQKRREIQERRTEYRLSLPDGSWRSVTPDPYNDPACKEHLRRMEEQAKSLRLDWRPTLQRREVLIVKVATITEKPGEWL